MSHADAGVDVDLGVLDLQSKSSGVQLHLASLARFAPSAEDDIDHLREILTQYKLNTNSKSRPWVIRGGSFRVQFSLETDCGLEPEEEDVLIQTLTARLQTTKLWADLTLSPAAIDSSNTAPHHHSIGVSLTHENVDTVQAKPKLHKLGAGVPFYDVLPPEGISSAILTSVHLNMRASRRPRGKRRQLVRQYSDSNIHQDANEDLLLPNTILCESMEPSSQYYDFGVSTACFGYEASEFELESEGEEEICEDTEMLLESTDEELRNEIPREPRVPPLLKRRSSETELELAGHTSPADVILDLIDAAIRMVISSSPRCLPKSVSVENRKAIQLLSELAPSLWCPGFLPAVSERAVFLPTIAHSLETVCRKSTVSGNLNKKVPRLNEKLFRDSDHPRAGCDLPLSTKSFTTPLWRTLEQGVHKAQSTKRLQSLTVPHPSVTAAAEFEDEVLDSTQESWQSDLLDDEDDEDGDGLLSLEEYEEIDSLLYEDLLDDDCPVDFNDSTYSEANGYECLFPDLDNIYREREWLGNPSFESLRHGDLKECSIWTESRVNELDEDMLSLPGSLSLEDYAESQENMHIAEASLGGSTVLCTG